MLLTMFFLPRIGLAIRIFLFPKHVRFVKELRFSSSAFYDVYWDLK